MNYSIKLSGLMVVLAGLMIGMEGIWKKDLMAYNPG